MVRAVTGDPPRWLTGVVLAVGLMLAAPEAHAAPQSIAIPAYFYPIFPDPLWAQMEQAVPTVGLAVMDPANGPGAAPDSNYVSQVSHTRATGVRVLGYVYTSYAARSLAAIEADIDAYYAWYGVDGISSTRRATTAPISPTTQPSTRT